MSDDRAPRLTRELIAQSDFIKLWGQPEFHRFMFTLLDASGMFTANFHSEDRIHAWREGRRSLGLDLLQTAESYSQQDRNAVLALILAAETDTQKEAPNGRRTSYPDERRAELGGPVDPDGRGDARPVFIDYGPDR
jgi:hypothetical protein